MSDHDHNITDPSREPVTTIPSGSTTEPAQQQPTACADARGVAADLITKGYALCAIPPGTKGPTTSGWGRHPLQRAEQLAPGAGIGIIHGLSGTVSIDEDHLELAGVALALVNAAEPAPGVPTWTGRENRRKRLYRRPANLQIPKVKKLITEVAGEPVTVFEVRGSTAGAQVQDVIPPSVHPDTGKPYRWLNGATCFPPLAELPVLPPELVGLVEHWDAWIPHMEAAIVQHLGRSDGAGAAPAGGPIPAAPPLTPAAPGAPAGYQQAVQGAEEPPPPVPPEWQDREAPGWEDLRWTPWSERQRTFLESDGTEGDRSAEAQSVANTLVRQLPDDLPLVLACLMSWCPEVALAPSRRDGDWYSGADWMWRFVVWPAVISKRKHDAVAVETPPPAPTARGRALQAGVLTREQVDGLSEEQLAMLYPEGGGSPAPVLLTPEQLRAHQDGVPYQLTEEQERYKAALQDIETATAAANPERTIPMEERTDYFTKRARSARTLVGEPEPRKWAWRNFIPVGVVTGFAGPPGIGKSTLAETIAVHKAVGRPLLGEEMEAGPVLYVSVEDDLDELHRRLLTITRPMGLAPQDLPDLHLLDATDLQTTLAVADPRDPSHLRIGKQRAAFESLIAELAPSLIVLDLSADFWTGADDNAAAPVRMYIRDVLGYFARTYEAGVLAISHPSKASMADGSGFAGSTAVLGSYRCGMVLSKTSTGKKEGEDEDGEAVRSDLLTLEVIKSNYGPCMSRHLRRHPDGHMLWMEQEALDGELQAQQRKLDDEAVAAVAEVAGESGHATVHTVHEHMGGLAQGEDKERCRSAVKRRLSALARAGRLTTMAVPARSRKKGETVPGYRVNRDWQAPAVAPGAPPFVPVGEGGNPPPDPSWMEGLDPELVAAMTPGERYFFS